MCTGRRYRPNHPNRIRDSHQMTMTSESSEKVTHRDNEYDASRGSRRALSDLGERAWRECRGDALLHRVGGAAGPVGRQGGCLARAVRRGGRRGDGPALYAAGRSLGRAADAAAYAAGPGPGGGGLPGSAPVRVRDRGGGGGGE